MVEAINFSQTQTRLFKYIQKKKEATRTQICKKLKLAWTTAYDNLAKLLIWGYLAKKSVSLKKRGRPKVYWVLNGKDGSNLKNEQRNN